MESHMRHAATNCDHNKSNLEFKSPRAESAPTSVGVVGDVVRSGRRLSEGVGGLCHALALITSLTSNEAIQ